MTPSEPILPRSWKNRYPFRIATTSFIFPAGYLENVDRLGPYVDEIELLMFESSPASRPDTALAADLAALAEAHAVRYDVHLPVDLPLTHPDAGERRKACRVLQAFIEVLLPLDPTAFVLHLEPPAEVRPDNGLVAWQRRASESLAAILQTGLEGRRLALENLFFPYSWLAPLLVEWDLSVCLDTGHLALQGQDLEPFLATFADRIAIGHLHGLRNGRDHAPLTGLPGSYGAPLAQWLGRFQETVTLEVFALDALETSLICLDALMAPIL
jgi:sugar phosphate isomerase/epimerase